MAKNKETQVTFLELKQLQINPFQPREKIIDSDEGFLELVESVKSQGILEPLVVVNTPAGYQIIAGERRFRAAKKVGIEKIPVHLINTSPKGMLEIAVVENIQRQDLSPIERAQAFNRLMQEFGYSIDKLSTKLGKSESYIKQSLRLLKLLDPVKDGLNNGLINEAQAKAILLAGDEKHMIDCYRQVVKEDASASRAATLARFFKEKINAKVAPVGRRNFDERGNLWQSHLQEQLKT
ncbi:MAG: ParB/RepB/Spo0J family partition protein, partial [Pseudomonadales bacterium]|nr:ParB/RepB/Spo0J family partition protein [Pseudomonadales bacterium]